MTVSTFKLSRHYSVASLGGILVVVVLLSLFYRQLAFGLLIQHEIRDNVFLTQKLAATGWDQYADFLKSSQDVSPEQLRSRPEVTDLRRDVVAGVMGLNNLVKVKLYRRDGMTVFSTEAAQIGESKGGNAGFQTALAGGVASDITYREQFDAFEGTISDRNVVSVYIPLQEHQGAPIVGVFEVYSDVTDLVAELEKTQWQIVAGVFGALALLYLFLFLIVRRADRLLHRQESDRQINEERIRYQAYHDPLTGLQNRTAFIERLEEAIKRAERSGNQMSLLFLDLDRFKLVNDSLGHDAGDKLLCITAERLRECFRESDMLFRMGGDEFTLLLEDQHSPTGAGHLAQRLMECLREPVKLYGQEVRVGATIGVSMYPKDARSAIQLVKCADAAMYRAKDMGKGRFAFYTEEMSRRANEQLELEMGILEALQNDKFVLHYQPRILLESGAVTAVEALVRWNHPTRGLVMPDEFIPFLEDTGLIIKLGDWVLRTACKQNRAWQDAGLPTVRVSVNISARQFRDPGLLTSVRHALRESNLAPEMLELELTESLLVHNIGTAMQTLGELKQLGVVISLDDFGTGYSSLSYLRHFPIDFLKIDRSFVAGMASNKKDAAIVRTISALARNLDVAVVAEGVEKAGQAQFLMSEHCHEMQGFLFSRPLPAADLKSFLEHNESARNDPQAAGSRLAKAAAATGA